jgi:hypothetical protein
LQAAMTLATALRQSNPDRALQEAISLNGVLGETSEAGAAEAATPISDQ